MKNVIELMKARREAAKNNDGFSLLELVVAVGILLVLTVGGLLAYNGITNNARQAAVDSAASEVYTAAVAYEADNQTDTDAAKAASDWMASQKGGAPADATDDTKGDIYVTADAADDGSVTVEATNVKTGQTSERTSTP